MRRLALIPRGLFVCGITILLTAGAGRVFSAEQQGRAIDISASKDESTATNAPDGLRQQLREDLLKEKLRERVLKPFQPGADSLDGMTSPQFTPPQRTLSPAEIRRIKEHLERNRSWSYPDTDTPGHDQPADGFPDANSRDDLNDRDTLSILKRQYQNLEAKNRLDNTNAPGRGDNPDDLNDTEDDQRHERTAAGVAEESRRLTNPNALNGLFSEQSSGELSPYGPRNSFSEAFAPASAAVPTEPSRFDTERASEFRKLLDGGSPGGLRASPLNPLGGVSVAGAPAGGDIKGLPTMATMPGYTPSQISASSLSPALAGPGGLAAPLQLPRPEAPRPTQFKHTGPPRRQF